MLLPHVAHLVCKQRRLLLVQQEHHLFSLIVVVLHQPHQLPHCLDSLGRQGSCRPEADRVQPVGRRGVLGVTQQRLLEHERGTQQWRNLASLPH
jgi:hypothetical protein